ncbi:PadR family transcriptional regulator [Planosporangium sp. 12N6]|uniref:PadR family transcriptional regulator n=1 Tax=Planosporangium spinosum TaxID=3402278 RepID=UPI003CEB3F94
MPIPSSAGSVTAHVLLGLLAAGPRHGYELKRAHDERLPRAKPLAYGQVYSTLGRLERDGLVEAAGQDQAGGPERTSYTLTAAGRAELAAWLGSVEPPAPFVSSTLLAKVVVALLVADADAARDYLVAQRQAHLDRLRELTAAKTAPGADLGTVIAADFAIVHLDADLRWLRTTLERVASTHGGVLS